MNQWCHICNGLVDRIGLQPSGVRLCGCKAEMMRMKRKLKEHELLDTIVAEVVPEETYNEIESQFYQAQENG